VRASALCGGYLFRQLERKPMFGLEDKYVSLAYLLCILSTLLCVVYGLISWNRGDDSIKQEDLHWEAEEKKAEEEI
jgi:hypothetical protein